jgi:hypothetical protein
LHSIPVATAGPPPFPHSTPASGTSSNFAHIALGVRVGQGSVQQLGASLQATHFGLEAAPHGMVLVQEFGNRGWHGGGAAILGG